MLVQMREGRPYIHLAFQDGLHHVAEDSFPLTDLVGGGVCIHLEDHLLADLRACRAEREIDSQYNLCHRCSSH